MGVSGSTGGQLWGLRKETERELGPGSCSGSPDECQGHQVSRGWDLHCPGQGEQGVFRWPGQGHTFTVHAVAPRSSWHGHLVLVAAGLWRSPLSPGGHVQRPMLQVTSGPPGTGSLG